MMMHEKLDRLIKKKNLVNPQFREPITKKNHSFDVTLLLIMALGKKECRGYLLLTKVLKMGILQAQL